jgi:hypothetical protein
MCCPAGQRIATIIAASFDRHYAAIKPHNMAGDALAKGDSTSYPKPTPSTPSPSS